MSRSITLRRAADHRAEYTRDEKSLLAAASSHLSAPRRPAPTCSTRSSTSSKGLQKKEAARPVIAVLMLEDVEFSNRYYQQVLTELRSRTRRCTWWPSACPIRVQVRRDPQPQPGGCRGNGADRRPPRPGAGVERRPDTDDAARKGAAQSVRRHLRAAGDADSSQPPRGHDPRSGLTARGPRKPPTTKVRETRMTFAWVLLFSWRWHWRRTRRAATTAAPPPQQQPPQQPPPQQQQQQRFRAASSWCR